MKRPSPNSLNGKGGWAFAVTSAMIVGRPNAGKTLFVLNFAEFLGAREWCLQRAGDSAGPAQRQALVSPHPHTTRTVQVLPVTFRLGKRRITLQLVDTAGLSDGIHADPAVRGAQALTIQRLLDAPVILHMFDASVTNALEQVDREIERFASGAGIYAVIANKMDLPGAHDGLARLRSFFPGRPLFPVSALRRQGFREVMGFVARSL
jgi:predicted GTPase